MHTQSLDQILSLEDAGRRLTLLAKWLFLVKSGYCPSRSARVLGLSAGTLRRWHNKFLSHGLDGLLMRPACAPPSPSDGQTAAQPAPDHAALVAPKLHSEGGRVPQPLSAFAA